MVDLRAVCLVQAAGHHPCGAPLSHMPSGIVVIIITMHRPCPRHTVPFVIAVPLCIFIALCPLALLHTVVIVASPWVIIIIAPFHHTPSVVCLRHPTAPSRLCTLLLSLDIIVIITSPCIIIVTALSCHCRGRAHFLVVLFLVHHHCHLHLHLVHVFLCLHTEGSVVALVVAARAVGHWAIGTARLCAAPGPLGLVDSGSGGCAGCAPIAFAVAVSCRHGCRFAVSCDRCRALVHNTWALQPSGWWLRGAGGALRSLSWSHTVEVVGWWWCTSVGNGAIGVAHLCTTPGPFDPVDRGIGGCFWCCPIADAIVVVGGSAVSWPLVVVAREHWEWGDRCHALVHNAWAFQPGGQGREGVRLVCSDCRHRPLGMLWFWPLVGHSLVDPHDHASCASAQRKGFPWMQGVSSRGRVPHERGGVWRTFTPLHRCWAIGRCLLHVSIAHVNRALRPLGLLATWLCCCHDGMIYVSW